MGTSSSPPKNAAANSAIVITDTVRLRLRNRRRSSSGCFGLKLHHTKAAIMSRPMVPRMMTLGEKKVPSPGIDETP